MKVSNMSKMIRISNNTNNCLDKLSAETGYSKKSLLEKAVDILLRKYFLEKTNKEYEALKKNPVAWNIELEERKLWDNILLDGLEDNV